MSKNTDFFKLGSYSRKNSIRTGIGTKIGQTESNRAKTAGPRTHTRRQCAGSARSRARKCTSRRPHARQPLRSRGSASPVRPGFAGNTCRHLAGAALLQPTVDACPAPVAALRRSPADLFIFFSSSLSSKIRNTVPFSDFHIFRSVDRIDMISSTKF